MVGIEPTTSASAGLHSIQLSYKRTILVPKGRFELPCPFEHYALNVARLPFRHFGAPIYCINITYAFQDSRLKISLCKNDSCGNITASNQAGKDTMIRPSHENCWYTNHKTTILSYDNNWFINLGVPLNVVLTAFISSPVIWFSVGFGQWNDNTLLIGVNPLRINSIQKIKHIDISPIEKVMGTNNGYLEYQLTSEIQELFGITLDPENNTYELKQEEKVVFQISVHDDCVCAITLVNSALLRALVFCVLEEHSYYLNEEIDWSGVVNWLADKLDPDHLMVRSQPLLKCLLIRREGIGPWFKAKINPKLYYPISINKSKARLTGK